MIEVNESVEGLKLCVLVCNLVNVLGNMMITYDSILPETKCLSLRMIERARWLSVERQASDLRV